jgi:protein involved in plasmid replication-relaxation
MSGRYLTRARLDELASRLTLRDLDVLQRVSSLRFVSGAQLTRLCFADLGSPAACARAARRSLLRLTRLEVLTRLPRPVGGVRAGSAGFVYRLGHVGLRLATLRSWQPERRWRRSFAPGMLFVRHALAVAELHTLLVENDRSRSIELLELSGEPSCWRNYDGLGGQRLTLKPDSYVRLGAGDYEDSYFIEVDRGTEGSRSIERQLNAYVSYYASGVEQAGRGVFPKVLWLAPGVGRVGVIEGCVLALLGTSRELFEVAQFEDVLAVMTGSERSSNGETSSSQYYANDIM